MTTCECGCGESVTHRFVQGHNGHRARPLSDRLWSRVDRTDSCWLWTGPVNSSGYGVIGLGDSKLLTHRVAYEMSVGPIPDGLDLDHLCHTRDRTCTGGESCPHRRCCNPAHLEPVTQEENVRRATRRITHCPAGHLYDEHNTYLRRGKSERTRECRTCHRLLERQRRRRVTAEKTSQDHVDRVHHTGRIEIILYPETKEP